jgi:hypothetical protein
MKSVACPVINVPAVFYKCAVEKVKTFKPKRRTADGKPDLNGSGVPPVGAMSIEEITRQYGEYAKMPTLNRPIPPSGGFRTSRGALEVRRKIFVVLVARKRSGGQSR